MGRTTLTLNPPLLKKLKALSHEEDVTLRKLVERLLQAGLESRKKTPRKPKWSLITHPMGAKIDLTDKDALYEILDREDLAR